MLQSYALQGKRIHIEEAPLSSRQIGFEVSQNSMLLGAEQFSSRHSHRTIESAGDERSKKKSSPKSLIAIKIVDD